MNTRILLLACLLPLLALVSSGCAVLLLGTGAAAGAGAVAYSHGELRMVEELPYEQVRDAASATLTQDLHLKLIETRDEIGVTTLVAEDNASGKTKVIVKKLSTHASELRIRVGILGDQAKSQAVYDAIKLHLSN